MYIVSVSNIPAILSFSAAEESDKSVQPKEDTAEESCADLKMSSMTLL